MLDRKAMPALWVLVLVMLVCDIWQVTHAARWSSMALFALPVTVMIAAGVLVLKERRAVASADAFAAWKEWGSFFLISCAAILTVFQLLPILQSLEILPSSMPTVRILLAGYGLVLVASGNRAPKLPPLEWRQPGGMSLGTAGQVAISRLAGWLLFTFGVTIIVSALFLPGRLIAPVMGSLALAMLVAILAKHRQLRRSELTH